MRASSLGNWLARRRPQSARPRRAVLGVNPFEDRMVPASLAGNVFLDSNNNGARDCGEPGIAGVKMRMVGKSDCGQLVCKTAVTDCNGDYKFEAVPGGWYALAECQPKGYRDGKDTVGSAGGKALGNDVVVCIRLNECDAACGYNFGERPACPPSHDDKDDKDHRPKDKDRCDDDHEERRKGNNGVGNGLDPQPPGNPPINDGPGTSPGNPGNRGGKDD